MTEQIFRPFDIVQKKSRNGDAVAVGMVTAVSSSRNACSVHWFTSVSGCYNAWLGPDEVTIIGNAMNACMAAMVHPMSGHGDRTLPNSIYPVNVDGKFAPYTDSDTPN